MSDGYVYPTEERTKKLLLNESILSNVRKYITYQLTNVYRLAESDLQNFNAWESFAQTLDLIENGLYEGDLESPRTKKRYYYSEIDDQNKIFAKGQSNGGFSMWVLSQKSPKIFAWICPSTGCFNPNELFNLSNIRTYYFTSDADPGHQYNTETINSYEDYLKDYKEIKSHKLIHNVFEQVEFYKPVLMDLMKAERNPYPDEVYYNTYMNRYRLSYRIEIYSMFHGKLYAKVHAKIQEGNIYISAKKLTGLMVTVPP